VNPEVDAARAKVWLTWTQTKNSGRERNNSPASKLTMLHLFRLSLSEHYNYKRSWTLYNNVTVTSHPQKTNFDQQHLTSHYTTVNIKNTEKNLH
jgi:hypothetical protein